MQLKHLNLTTSDVTGLAAFFEQFFGFGRLLERGSGAFTILRNHEDFGQAFCIILDINLNDVSGIDLREQLAAAGILLPVIYITGNDNHATRMAALQSGCIAYLVKPFPAKSLIEPLEMAASA